MFMIYVCSQFILIPWSLVLEDGKNKLTSKLEKIRKEEVKLVSEKNHIRGYINKK